MNLQARLISTTVMIVAGLGLMPAIAAEPATQPAAQTPRSLDVCQQAGPEYRQLYTIEEAHRSITICQKDNQYYHITTEKRHRLVVRYAEKGSSQP